MADLVTVFHGMPEHQFDNSLFSCRYRDTRPLSDVEQGNLTKYPHLTPESNWVKYTEKERIRPTINRDDSILEAKEKAEMYELIEKHRVFC
jgi:hypothetical protein